MTTTTTRVGTDGKMIPPLPTSSTLLTKSNAIWLYIIGFFTGIVITLTVTILIGWIINKAFPHSSFLNKAFYGYALGCSSAAAS